MSEIETGSAIIKLMQGVVYRETDEDTWLTLERSPAGVRDHFSAIGVEVVIDEVEGYAYLRSRPVADGETALPRLVQRRKLSYQVSLLLVLLRKRLLEFETSEGDGRLVVTTQTMVDMLSTFQADSSNDAQMTDQAGLTIKKAADLGFLAPLRNQPNQWEVKRILKAYVDAGAIATFLAMLEAPASDPATGPEPSGKATTGSVPGDVDD